MDKPALDNETQREQFLDDLDTAIDEKQYPACDVSLSEDVLVAMFTREAAEASGRSAYADAVDQRIERIFDVPQAVIDASEDGRNPAADEDNETMAFLYSTQVWREAIGSFTQEDNGDVMHGGDYANDVITADTLQDAIEALHAFRSTFLYDVAQNAAEQANDPSNDVFDGLTEPDASIHNILVYNGMLMTVHRRELGDEITEQEMRVP